MQPLWASDDDEEVNCPQCGSWRYIVTNGKRLCLDCGHDSSRPSPDEYFINILREVARRSTCLRSRDSAIIVRGLQVISTGYNGAPSKLPHCSEVGCIREQNAIPSGERHELCRGAHAESNAIAYAARYGISVEGATMYCTRYPCSFCAKIIVNAGIKRVVYVRNYADGLAKKLLVNVQIEQFGE